MKIRNSILSAIVALATFTCMAATESQTQPQVGKPAPDFSLTTGDGSQLSLKDYRGKWVVLYFYPKDFTSGCTLEAHNFQRDLAKYSDAGAVILGVSVDTAQSHKDFCAKEGLNFKLLADPDAKVSTAYNSVMDYQGTKLSSRNTFLIDPSGKIARSTIFSTRRKKTRMRRRVWRRWKNGKAGIPPATMPMSARTCT